MLRRSNYLPHCNKEASMRSFDKAMHQLQGLRRKFEGLLTAARAKADRDRAPSARPAGRLKELTGFGANPGNLCMHAYVPESMPATAPLVVALHGCGQTADEYDIGTGWSSLAERHGFAVVYPEQQSANNPKNCFSWFVPGDIARGQGEAHSIWQMIEHAVTTFGSDRRRIFVTGLSAGGAMASTMLATYPEVFAGGAIIAGLPHGCAHTVQQAFDAMFTEQTHSAAVLGNRVRAASKHRGPWPKISIWHGSADPIVKPSNAEQIIRQWTDVHGLSAAPSYEENVGSHNRRVWNDETGEALIEAFAVSGMAHGVPLASTGANRCGVPGPFFLDAGISSTHHVANFWRLGEDAGEIARVPATVTAPRDVRPVGRAIVAPAEPADAASNSDAPSFDENAEPEARRFLDPNVVIAAAFKACGLPVPELPNISARAAQVAPDPIIKAALKAAGLSRD
jgi:poly(hydroxyalkanoate) depolymerase family esterase